MLLAAGIGSLYPLKQLGTGLLLILLTLFNAVMGMQQEGKAAAAVAALQKMVIIKARVRRDGQLTEIPAELVDWRRDASAAAAMLTPSSERLARRPGVITAGNRPVPALVPGDLVNHDSYGLGRVLSVEGRGDDPEAKVDFGEEYGIKHLLLRYAPVEKL